MVNSFDKIIGYESVKKELYQVIDIFKNKDVYLKMGAKMPRGVLIFGDPGLGKTMMALALIDECKVRTYYLTKNKIKEQSIREITLTFTAAAKDESAIVFIDDIDKFSETKGYDEDDSSFVAIQAGIDSVKSKNVLVVATANNYNKLPGSLLRNGRFDVKINMDSPSNDDAKKIVEYYLKTKKVNKNMNFEDVVKMISYSTCADLESIINKSAIYAAYQRKEFIDIDDIVNSYLQENYDVRDESYKCSEEELEAVSMHEAGHIVIAEAIKEGSVGFASVKIAGRSGRLGFTKLCDDLETRTDSVLMALGGKVATETFYNGRCGSGCQSDLKMAASLIRDGLIGNATCGLGMLDVSNSGARYSSDSFAGKYETVTQAELERHLIIARQILINNKDFLLKLAKKLKEKKTLLYSDIRSIRESTTINKIPY